MITREQILKEIGCPLLTIHRYDDYFYFVYDNEEKNVFETHSVYVAKLNSLKLHHWVNEGKDFVKTCEKIAIFS